MDDAPGPVLETIWAALGGSAESLAGVDECGVPPLPSRLAAAELVRDAVAAASLAAAVAGSARRPAVRLDAARVATAVTSERHLRVDGRPPDVWAELSGFWRAADGWVRTHANYPHHRRRLLTGLGLPDGADRADLADRVGGMPAHAVEDRVAAEGGVAVAVRSPEEWRRHPQAGAVRGTPLVVVREHRGGEHRAGVGHHADPVDDPSAPLAGVRVLDLTRVIAGPVATRTLALLGAQVLRVDPRDIGEPEWQHLDTGAGKRSTRLDLRDPGDRARFDALLASADVLVTGYRPGALDALGLAPATLAEARPGLVVGRVSAWGTTGPWAGRRGFDSIVQAATGIAVVEGTPDGRPGALPAQALDHCAGYVLAAGVTLALHRRRTTGTGATVEVALARLAQELLAGPVRPDAPSVDGWSPTVADLRTSSGTLTVALPALGHRGAPADWPRPPRPWGRDEAAWT